MCGSLPTFHTLTRLSARDDFIQFCRRESFKTCRLLLFTIETDCWFHCPLVVLKATSSCATERTKEKCCSFSLSLLNMVFIRWTFISSWKENLYLCCIYGIKHLDAFAKKIISPISSERFLPLQNFASACSSFCCWTTGYIHLCIWCIYLWRQFILRCYLITKHTPKTSRRYEGDIILLFIQENALFVANFTFVGNFLSPKKCEKRREMLPCSLSTSWTILLKFGIMLHWKMLQEMLQADKNARIDGTDIWSCIWL
jgi:hypothetical protein